MDSPPATNYIDLTIITDSTIEKYELSITKDKINLKGAKEGENPNITTGIGIKVKKHANQYYLRLTVGNPFDVMDIYCIDYEVVDYDLIKNIYIRRSSVITIMHLLMKLGGQHWQPTGICQC